MSLRLLAGLPITRRRRCFLGVDHPIRRRFSLKRPSRTNVRARRWRTGRRQCQPRPFLKHVAVFVERDPGASRHRDAFGLDRTNVLAYITQYIAGIDACAAKHALGHALLTLRSTDVGQSAQTENGIGCRVFGQVPTFFACCQRRTIGLRDLLADFRYSIARTRRCHTRRRSGCRSRAAKQTGA